MTAWILCASLLVMAHVRASDAQGLEFFEKKIRPMLTEKCVGCHNSTGKAKGALMLDSRQGMLTGGNDGAAIVPGSPEKSLLIKAISYKDAELKMPPKEKGGQLSADEIANFETWIKMGAPDPREGTVKKLTGLTAEARAHWAYQQVKKPDVPKVDSAGWARNEIDAFVFEKLQANGLKPASQASKDALIRRASYDLIGLPPTVEEARAFIDDASPEAFAKVVDRLLASPHYGERWGRHWLDSARYSDTRGLISNGQKYRFEDYRYMYAWTYRDYVIRAINDDKPYDKFIVEQLAADRLPGVKEDDERLAALGFLTVGKRFNDREDIIDERIDTVTKAFLGMTASCARCHDHKFDPVSIADYYALHGVFASSMNEPYSKPMLKGSFDESKHEDYEKKLTMLQNANRQAYYKLVTDLSKLFYEKSEGWVHSKMYKSKSVERFDIYKKFGITEKSRVDREVENAIKITNDNPVFGVASWFIHTKADAASAIAEIIPTMQKRLNSPKSTINPMVAKAFLAAANDIKSTEDVAKVYAKIFTELRPTAMAFIEARSKGEPTKLDTATQQLCEAVYPIPTLEELDTPEKVLLAAEALPLENEGVAYFKFNELNSLRISHPGAPGGAMTIYDFPSPHDSRIFLRGDKRKPGDLVPRRFIDSLAQSTYGSETAPKFSKENSGRLELAEAIASPKNPLTARVLVNRVWMHHFGEGFIRTPDDLGTQSEKPSHPELLDYLAAKFMEDGWSQKKLHRQILLSASYQQSSEPNAVAEGKDAPNRLIWRQNLRRLDFEAIRDSMVLLTGRLESELYGKPVNLTDEPYCYRRSIYGYVDRLQLSDLMSQFDYADPTFVNSARTSTVVPQQALFFMNSAMSVDVARQVVAREDVAQAINNKARVQALYSIVFQREPKPEEIALADEFIAGAEKMFTELHPKQAAQLVVVPPKLTDSDVKELNKKAARLAVKAAKTGDTSMMMNFGKQATIKNEGVRVKRAPLTPWELYTHALLLSNEFVYVN